MTEAATISEQTQAVDSAESVAAVDTPPMSDPKYASFWVRFGARLIDLFVLIVLFIIASFVGGMIINTAFPEYAENERIFVEATEALTQSNLEGVEDAENPFAAGFDAGFQAGLAAASCEFNTQREIEACEAYSEQLPIASGAIMAFQGLIYFVYYVVATATGMQGSLGKMMLKLKVVNENNEMVSFAQSTLREVFILVYYIIGVFGYALWFASILANIAGLTFIISSIIAAFDEKKQALHDKIAKTFVIKAS